MASSIFNSEKRVLLALLSAIAVIIPLGVVNIVIHLDTASGRDGTIAMQKFFNRKVAPSQKYDMVFLGDSRVLTGINPEFFERKLNCTAFNAAFTGGGINGEILRHAAEKLLSGNTRAPRSVIIGMTAMSMGESSRRNKSFNQIKSELAAQGDGFFSDYIRIPFQKIRSKHFKNLFKNEKPATVPYDNGYLERFAVVKKKAQERSIQTYRISFHKYKFSQENLRELIGYVRMWKKENVTVFVFRPPVNPAMDALENEFGKCDFALIQRIVEESGGVWLEVDKRETYNSYDSSHLASDEAIRLSEDLSDKVAAHFRKKTKSLASQK